MQLRNFHAVGPQCFFRIGLRSTLDTRWIERSDVPIGSDAWTEKLDRVGETPSFLLRHPLSLTQIFIVQPLSLLCNVSDLPGAKKASEHVWSCARTVLSREMRTS
jgi:hypothetical protein